VHRSPSSQETIVEADADIIRIAAMTICLSSCPWMQQSGREGIRMDGIVEIVDTVEVLPT
jgi:hypothetical protein